MTKTIGIICAFERELAGLIAKPPSHARIVAGGIGAKAAERAARLMDCSALISTGYAGGLAAPAARGVIVVDTATNLFDYALPQSARGRIADSQMMVATPAARAALAAETGAIAVDMESAAIARVATERGIPFAAIRVITDGPDDTMVIDWDRYRRPDGSMRTTPAVLSALRSRQGIAELFRLWYASKEASLVLNAYLKQFLESWKPL
jgi:adenosylhomocysteine nucleosidase